jgi:hypothetical protein
VLDNLRLGIAPRPATSAAAVVTQRGPDQPIDVRQLYGQVLLPFGVLTAGRMGALVDWGTGFFLNAGNGLDDDYGDVGDRIAFTTPLAGLLWTALYEISATGPGSDAVRPRSPAFDLDPRDDVRTVAFSVSRYDSPAHPPTASPRGPQHRQLRPGGQLPLAVLRPRAGASPRRNTAWCATSRPSWATPGCAPTSAASPSRASSPSWASASATPPSTPRRCSTSRSPGGSSAACCAPTTAGEPALLRAGGVRLRLGDDRDRASGRAPTATAGGRATSTGRSSTSPARPRDVNINNFRFHPNYRVDLIMWRRLIGTVTDAWYVRPMVRYRSVRCSPPRRGHRERGDGAQQHPSGRAPLGVETDLGLIYEQEHGFVARASTTAVLRPPRGLSTTWSATAEPELAHALHLVMAWRF